MTQPQLSPDGQWWWTGAAWVPADQAPIGQPPAAAAAPPAYGAPTYGGYPAPPTSSNDGLAITSLISGLVWMGGVGSVVAVITGHLSRSNAKKQGRSPSGMALAGLILGYLGIAGAVVLLVGLITLGGVVTKAIDQDQRARSDLRSAANLEETYFVDHNTYVDLAGLRAEGFTPTPGIRLEVVSFSESRYCLKAEPDLGTPYYFSSGYPTVTQVPCS